MLSGSTPVSPLFSRFLAGMVFIEVLAKKKKKSRNLSSKLKMKEQEFFFNACVNTEGPALRTLVLPEPGARPSVPASFLSTSCKRPLFQIQSLFPHLNRGLSFLRDPGSGEEALYSPYHSQV